MILISGTATGEDMGNQPEESIWVRKAPAKEPEFDLEHERRHSLKLRRAAGRPPLQVVRINQS